MMTSLGSVSLVALGFFLGKIDLSQESHAQQAEVSVNEHFVVVSGHTNGRSENRFFVVRGDGTATAVTTEGKSVSAPKPAPANNNATKMKLELEHSFKSSKNKLDLQHHGQIRQ